jgi:hypothetical protein
MPSSKVSKLVIVANLLRIGSKGLLLSGPTAKIKKRDKYILENGKINSSSLAFFTELIILLFQPRFWCRLISQTDAMFLDRIALSSR